MKPRSVMMYGTSGSTKTSQLYHLVKWLLAKPENEGKVFRIVHSDPGGYAPFIDSGMIEEGKVQLYDLSAATNPLAECRWLSQRYWPRKVKGSDKLYFKKVDACYTSDEDWDKILGYAIEGLSSTAEKLKSHCSNQTEGIGFKESWKYEEEGETFVGLQQGHYGLIQKEVYSLHTTGFNCLPIQWLVYTSLLGKGVDKKEGKTYYGPQVVGDALTTSVPSWFVDCLHLDRAKWSDEKGEHDGMVAWFTKHPDSIGDEFLCKARVLPELYPKLLELFPYGFVPLGFEVGVERYFHVLEKLNKG